VIFIASTEKSINYKTQMWDLLRRHHRAPRHGLFGVISCAAAWLLTCWR